MQITKKSLKKNSKNHKFFRHEAGAAPFKTPFKYHIQQFFKISPIAYIYNADHQKSLKKKLKKSKIFRHAGRRSRPPDPPLSIIYNNFKKIKFSGMRQAQPAPPSPPPAHDQLHHQNTKSSKSEQLQCRIACKNATKPASMHMYHKCSKRK